MSIQYKWENNGLYRQFTNKICGKEILNINLSMQGDPRFDDIRYVINDFTKVIEFDFSDLDIKKITVMDNAASISNPNIKNALVSTHEPLLVWIKIYCEIMESSPYECEIFDTVDDAYRWVSE